MVILLYCSANLLFVNEQNWSRFIPVYLGTSTLLVLKIMYGNGILHRWFCAQLPEMLGRISYSFYLFHGLAIVVICDYIGVLIPQPLQMGRLPFLMVGSFLFSILLAWASYVLLERPYFERRARSEAPHQQLRNAVKVLS
jgi:peptidoglycan/LPS O-acetylase OafA/YrhL